MNDDYHFDWQAFDLLISAARANKSKQMKTTTRSANKPFTA